MRLRAPTAAAVLALLAAAPAAHAAIPTLHVRTAKQIRDDPKVAAKIRAGGRTLRAEIEYRGSSTLAFPKKPYAIETDRKTRLLGMPRERDWVLNAAYTDPTLLRDALAHAAARRLGLAASRSRHVHLRVNGRYRGVYVLMERAELSDRRVRGDALLELTEPRKLDDGDASFAAAGGLAVRHVEPDEADKKKARAARAAVGAFEAALGGPGWRAHLDERSAVDYVLLAELLRNQEAFMSSTYLHQREDGVLALGPVWDFDLSAGNAVDPAVEGWLLTGRVWAGALLADPGFRSALAARWRALRAGGFVEALLRDVDARAAALRRPARRNFARWDVLGRAVFPGQPVQASHAAAVAALKDWIVKRTAWMDGAFANGWH
jgi:CotH kinase protein